MRGFETVAMALAAAAITTGCTLLVSTAGLRGDGGDALVGADASADAGDVALPPSEGGPRPARTILLAAGLTHTCAAIDGVAWCWGQNTSGELGDGTKRNADTPVRVQGLPSGALTAMGAGHGTTCVVVGGDVYCWGSAGGGALGTGSSTDSPTPIKIAGLPPGATAVGAGGGFACALVGATTYCWGNNGVGRLGDGTTTSHKQPSAVVDAQGIVDDFAAISIGGDHACGIRTSGDAVCWGHNDDMAALGNAGVGDSSPRAVPVLDLPGKVDRVRIAGWHACATVSGGLWCWGRGTAGELGNGGSASSAAPVPVDGHGDGVTFFETAGGGSDDGDATCAVRNGVLSCWGNGAHGRLGNGETAPKSRPVPVTTLPSTVVSIVGGENHWCAHLANGEIRCWGQGNFGQLGDGASVDRFTPVRVAGL